jgi:hypothetical protein
MLRGYKGGIAHLLRKGGFDCRGRLYTFYMHPLSNFRHPLQAVVDEIRQPVCFLRRTMPFSGTADHYSVYMH